ncbi:MAG: hypothetical protein AAGJ28_07225 [Pseudomonadota bacterium]
MSARVIDLTSRQDFINRPRATPDAEEAALSELRRARVRIVQLERNLTEAMRDSLTHFNRARDAERRLEELSG